jgi:hypothetical protein
MLYLLNKNQGLPKQIWLFHGQHSQHSTFYSVNQSFDIIGYQTIMVDFEICLFTHATL